MLGESRALRRILFWRCAQASALQTTGILLLAFGVLLSARLTMVGGVVVYLIGILFGIQAAAIHYEIRNKGFRSIARKFILIILGASMPLLFFDVVYERLILAGRKKSPMTFSGLVATNVLVKKLSGLVVFAVMAATGQFIGFSPVFVVMSAIAAAWYMLDIIAVSYRIHTGQYGNSDIEALEAARYVMQHRKDHDGGGHFDGVFLSPSLKLAGEDIHLGAPEGARS